MCRPRGFRLTPTHRAKRSATPEMVAQECEDAAIEGATWKAVWLHHARTWGWVDLDGCVLASAQPYRLAARRGYLKGRRFFLDEPRLRARFDALKPSAPEAREPTAHTEAYEENQR